ncbi:hypothetical protein GCM10027398_06560 [Azotobacter salinestris]
MAGNRTFRQSMTWLHGWAGLLLGWLLFAIFLTGTLTVFDKEISWWMQPELRDTGVDQPKAVRFAQHWLAREHGEAAVWSIDLPTERSPVLKVSTGEDRHAARLVLDPESEAQVPVRDSVGGNFFFRFHYSLLLPRTLGIWLVGLAAMAMLVALVSGIVIHRHLFRDFFAFRPVGSRRAWLDGHNASAVLLLPFHLMITYTGLVIFFLIYMPAALDALYGGDRMAMQREASPGAPCRTAAAGVVHRPGGGAVRTGHGGVPAGQASGTDECPGRGESPAGQPHRPDQRCGGNLRRGFRQAPAGAAGDASQCPDPAGHGRAAFCAVRWLSDALAVFPLQRGQLRDDRQRPGAVRHPPALQGGRGECRTGLPAPGRVPERRHAGRPHAGLRRAALGRSPAAGGSGRACRLGGAPVLRRLGPGVRPCLVASADDGLARAAVGGCPAVHGAAAARRLQRAVPR